MENLAKGVLGRDHKGWACRFSPLSSKNSFEIPVVPACTVVLPSHDSLLFHRCICLRTK